jgi:ABC-type transport system involved in cytochrome bd biosynthesis fused ATPase/permease subunit
LQIVMHMQVVQGYWAAWKSLTEKLSIVEEGLQEPGEVSLEAYITPELIRVSQNGVATSFGEISLSGAGRITISGANGAGKSTALLALKAREGAGAVYLPAHHVLELAEEGGSLSSGEAALSALRCAAASTSPVLLLDEWDANLSPENRAWQHAFIEELARSRVVVEVRHS